MLHKKTVKLNLNEERGSGTIYVKKDLMEKLKLPPNTDLYAEYDDEKNELVIREL